MVYGENITNAKLPDKLSEIPQKYFTGCDHQGTLVEIGYDTYESMTYEQQTTMLHKRAIVYLPYGYSEDTRYNVFYLMHGGWSDETAYISLSLRHREQRTLLISRSNTRLRQWPG